MASTLVDASLPHDPGYDGRHRSAHPHLSDSRLVNWTAEQFRRLHLEATLVATPALSILFSLTSYCRSGGSPVRHG